MSIELPKRDKPTPRRQKKVLIVDDDIELCESLVSTFERKGVQAQIFLSGDAALREIRMSTDDPYDLVVLDLILPGLTGEGVLGALDQLGILNRSTCVIFSGADTERIRDVSEKFQVRAIEKPFGTEDLFKMVSPEL